MLGLDCIEIEYIFKANHFQYKLFNNAVDLIHSTTTGYMPKHLAAFREGTKVTKPTILAMAMKEITNMASNMPKKEKGTMAAVSDIFGPKLV